MHSEVELKSLMRQALRSIAPEIMENDLNRDDLDLQDCFDLDSVDMVRYLSKLQEVTGISLSGVNYREFVTLKSGLSKLKMIEQSS